MCRVDRHVEGWLFRIYFAFGLFNFIHVGSVLLRFRLTHGLFTAETGRKERQRGKRDPEKARKRERREEEKDEEWNELFC